MTVNEYQLKAHSFSFYEKPVCYEDVGGQVVTHNLDFVYPALALAEEAGEVAGKFAKAVRDESGNISTERKNAIEKELGDVCWFIAELCTIMGFSMEEVMQHNIDKLTDRKARNVLKGSGDNR